MFGQAVGWLRRNRVLLPGVSVLARPVASVRDAAGERMYRTLACAAAAADPTLSYRLEGLLAVPEGQRVSELERLRAAPRPGPLPGHCAAAESGCAQLATST